MKLLRKLKPFDRKSGHLNVVIDTPKGCRNKYAFDFELNAYKLKTVLPHGVVFPFDFGSIPGTIAADGDPVDILVLMDEPAFVGCLVEARVLGVIEADQTEDGKTERDDRSSDCCRRGVAYACLLEIIGEARLDLNSRDRAFLCLLQRSTK